MVTQDARMRGNQGADREQRALQRRQGRLDPPQCLNPPPTPHWRLPQGFEDVATEPGGGRAGPAARAEGQTPRHTQAENSEASPPVTWKAELLSGLHRPANARSLGSGQERSCPRATPSPRLRPRSPSVHLRSRP